MRIVFDNRAPRRVMSCHVALLDKMAYAAISGSSMIEWGRQAGLFGGARGLPNPGGPNRALGLDALVAAYLEARIEMVSTSYGLL